MAQKDRTLLGNLLVERNLISQRQLEEAIATQRATGKQLGEILVGENLVSTKQIKRVLRVQKKLRTTILTSLLSLSPLALTGCGGGAAAVTESRAISDTQTSSESAEIHHTETLEVISGGGGTAIGSDNAGSVAGDGGTTFDLDADTSIPGAIAGSGDFDGGEPTASGGAQPDSDASGGADADSGNARGDAEPEGGEAASADIQISFQPVSRAATAGEDVTLNVSATGSGTLSYQWYKDGEPIADAVMASLTLRSVGEKDGGVYSVNILNDTGEVSSDSAVLDVEADRSARLSWDPPSKRADGSDLDDKDIKTYRIYHSMEDGSFETTYDIDPADGGFVVDDLPPGEHFFAITAVDKRGQESDLSNMVVKRIF